jgi:adenine-specific DNA-methyltransferase
MIYPRLRVARDLLSDDGMIFISMGEEEIENILKICDEIFGKRLRMGTFIWKRRQMVDSRSKTGVSEDHEYLICYAKTVEQRIRGNESDMTKYSNPDNDPRGDWMSADMTGLATASQRPNLHYDLNNPETGIIYACPPTGWRYDKKRMAQLIKDCEVIFPQNSDGRPRRKKFVKDLQNNYAGLSTILKTVYNTQATRELKLLFDGNDYFDFPKPVDFIKLIIQQGSLPDSIILDFFSGSATTAHAVMQLNAEDGGKRKFIMVQLPEKCDEGSEAAKAGYKNICEIGKERIRRAGLKILQQITSGSGRGDGSGYGMGLEGLEEYRKVTGDSVLDAGFRVLKLDSSNMKDVYYTPQDTVSAGGAFQRNLDELIDNIKPDRSPEDLLFQVMLDLGVPLSSKIEQRAIGGKAVFSVADNYLMACFDRATDEIVTEIAKSKPYYAVFRDSSFASDATLTNFEQIFKTYSPTTKRRVL